MYTDVYACGKMPKNPLSIFHLSHRQRQHIKFTGQKTAFLGNTDQSESETHQLDRRST
jgi:hypothetical protein